MRTRIFAALGLLSLSAAACTSTDPTFGGDSGDGSTAQAKLVLRIEEAGGFVPLDYTFARQPSIVVMSDGRIYSTPAMIEIYPGPLHTSYEVRRVEADGIAAIRDRAEEAGLVTSGQQDPDPTGPQVADATTTVFTYVDAGGAEHEVSAYALGFNDPETPERQALAAFRDDMTNLAAWLPEGSIIDEGSIESATAMRIGVRDYTPDQELPQEAVAWPLDEPLATIGEPVDNPVAVERCVVLTGDDLATFIDAAEGANALTPWTSGGERFGLLLDPMTPDEEPTCEEPETPIGY